MATEHITPFGTVTHCLDGTVQLPPGRVCMPSPLPPVRYVSTGKSVVAFVTEGGDLYSWNAGEPQLRFWNCGANGPVRSVACDGECLLVLFEKGIVAHLYCGRRYGKSGFRVRLPAAAAHVRAGHKCWGAILADGRLFTWGSEADAAQLGREGGLLPREVPIGPVADMHWSSLHYAAALTTEGRLYLWGGRGSMRPMCIDYGVRFCRLGVSRMHVMAIESDGNSAFGWGSFGNTAFRCRRFSAVDGPVQDIVANAFSHELFVHCLPDAVPHSPVPRPRQPVYFQEQRRARRAAAISVLCVDRTHRSKQRRARRSTTQQRPRLGTDLLPLHLWREVIMWV